MWPQSYQIIGMQSISTPHADCRDVAGACKRASNCQPVCLTCSAIELRLSIQAPTTTLTLVTICDTILAPLTASSLPKLPATLCTVVRRGLRVPFPGRANERDLVAYVWEGSTSQYFDGEGVQQQALDCIVLLPLLSGCVEGARNRCRSDNLRREK